MKEQQINIGVSACLFDIKCRYNGVAAKDDFIIQNLQKHINIKPYCPEAFLGTPREPIRLLGEKDAVRVITVDSKKDVTYELVNNSQELATTAHNDDLSGFIFKSKSPSCGMERVKIYHNDTRCEKKGVGVFAREIQKIYPYLPIEEEGRLSDDWLKENFISSVFAYHQITQFLASSPSISDLIVFHSQYKYFLYAKHPELYKKMGVIVANDLRRNINEVLFDYKKLFMQIINHKNTINNTYNVLMHIFGYFKKHLDAKEKQELLKIMQDFKDSIVPLITVIKIMQLYVAKFEIDYLKEQVFFRPYPDELALRSSIKAYK